VSSLLVDDFSFTLDVSCSTVRGIVWCVCYVFVRIMICELITI
jgi:hypothetical protein